MEAADSCFVAGELTAWRVHADKIILEKGAQANIMLQESEALELHAGVAARLPGYLVPRLVREIEGAPAKTPVSAVG